MSSNSIGRVQAEVGLDTTTFDAGVKRVEAGLDATARAAERASQRAQVAWQRELLAQDKAAQKAAEVARTKELAALKSDILARSQEVEAQKADLADRSYQRLISSLGSAAAVTGKAAAANLELAASHEAVASASGHSVSQMQAASATIRLVEGGMTNNIRAVERFISTIPGVGAALQSAFSIIGAAALLGLVVKLGQEFYNWEQKAVHAADAIKESFEEMNDEMRDSNIQMRITADHLEDEIAKLEKKPANGLQTGIDEATQAADRLATSLDKDIQKIKELTEKNQINFFAGLISAKGPTKDTSELILQAKQQVDQVRKDYDEVVDQVRQGGDQKNLQQVEENRAIALEKVYKQADDTLAAALGAAQQAQDFHTSTASAFGSAITTKGGGVSYESSHDNAANIELLKGSRGILGNEQDAIGEAMRVGTDQKTKGGLSKSKSDGDNKAAEAQMKSFEDVLNRRKADQQVAVVDEINFWEAMLKPAAKYPENIQKIYATLGTLTQEYYRQLDAIAARAVEARKRAQEQMQQQDQQMLEMMKRWEELDSRRGTALAKLTEAQQRSGDAAMEQAIKFQVMTGAISQHDAALQMAALHAADYRAQLEELDREAAEDAQRSTLNPDERDTRAADRDIRRVDITGQMNRTSIADQQQIANSTMLGGATDALREFTAAALDGSKQMREVVSNALSQINDAILGDQRGRFKHAAGSIVMSGARSGLQAAEGYGLKALGINGKGKKPTGTQNDPIYVAMAKARAAINGGASLASTLERLFGSKGGSAADGVASGVSGSVSSVVSGIGGLLMGMGGDAGTASTVASAVSGGVDAGEGISSIFSALGGLAFFANGTGPLTADTTAMVGERGPELVNLPRGSSVTPNRDLPKMGGDTHQYFIDATGSADPAQVETAVNRAMSRVAPGIVRASVGAVQSQAARRPMSAR